MGVFQGLWRVSRLQPLALCSLVFALAISPARADAPTLAGVWSASPLTVNWQLGDWGKACGPAPSGGGEGGGSVTISQSGNELTIVGTGRTYITTECWERYPGMQRISHSGSSRNFQNVCKTGTGDPRQAKLVTTISATDSRINFDETGQYQFVIEGQNCTASVRRTRSYSLVSRLGVAPAATPSSATAPPKPAPRPTRDCEDTGLPERLEVRPSRKLMRPGESFEFRSNVVDAHGCALPVSPTWRVISGANVLSVTAPGKVTANPNATESKATLEVTLGDRSVRVDVEIASKERYDAVLQARGLDESGESKDAAVLRVASESMGAREVVARDEAPARTRTFVALAGVTALVLGCLGLLLVRRRRVPDAPAPESPSRPRASAPVPATSGGKACPTCREEFPADAEFCPNDGNRLVAQTTLVAGPAGSVCPVCGRGFNPGTLTCPEHGEELIPAPAFAARHVPTLFITRTICPVCGTQYTAETRFCGECGASVVPVN
jgi:RNA polymerase subunit RPABC4/transcription elongation factor Spt4